MGTGTRVHLGRAVVLDTGGIEIAVIENNHGPYDLDCFRWLGIEPTEKRYLEHGLIPEGAIVKTQ